MEQVARAPVKMVTLSEVLATARDDDDIMTLPIVFGRIYFLYLDEIRKALGIAEWRAKQAVIHGAVVSSIRRAILPEDVCVQLADDQYIIVFGEEDTDHIATRCRRIADLIERTLFGEKGLGRVVIRHAARVFADGSIAGRVVDDDLVETARDLMQPPDSAGPARRSGSAFSGEGRKARRANLLQILEDAREEALCYDYVPVWHARESRIATFMVNPRRGDGRNVESGYDVLGPAPDSAALAQLDTHALEECLFALRKLCDNGHRLNLMTSVHFETLANRSPRAQLKELLAAIPRTYGKLLTLNICHVPVGIPENRLTEIAVNLGDWVRNLAVLIPIADCPTLQQLGTRALPFSHARFGVIGLDFKGVTGITEDVLERARRWASALMPRGSLLSAVNVPSREALFELSTSEFAFLAGEGIGGPEARPERPRPFTTRDLEGL